MAGLGSSSTDFSAWLFLSHQVLNISLPHSLFMFGVEIILQTVEVDHLSPIVAVVLFIVLSSFLP